MNAKRMELGGILWTDDYETAMMHGDQNKVEEIDNIIRRIHAEHGCAILMVEQNLEFVRAVIVAFGPKHPGDVVQAGGNLGMVSAMGGAFSSIGKST